MSQNRIERMAMRMDSKEWADLSFLLGQPYPHSLQDKINMLKYVKARCDRSLEKPVRKRYLEQINRGSNVESC